MNKNSGAPLLLDTHVWLWLLNGDLERDHPAACEAVERALKIGSVCVSAISMWEVAMLEARKRIALPVDCLIWVRRALRAPGIELEELSPEVAVASTRLPEGAPADPADRMIIASAMSLGAVIVTHDRQILNYAERQQIPVLAV